MSHFLKTRFPTILGLLALLTVLPCLSAPPDDPPVPHDFHQPHPLPTPTANDVRAVAVGSDGAVWAATADGLFRLDPPHGTRASHPSQPAPWLPIHDKQGLSIGSAFALTIAPDNTAWIGAWDGLHHATPQGSYKIPGIPTPVSALAAALDGTVLAGGPTGFFFVKDTQASKVEIPASRYLGRIVAQPDGSWWLATGMGLYQWHGDHGDYRRDPNDRSSLAVRGLAFDPSGRLWAATLGGLQVFDGTRLRRTIAPPEALPSADVRCVVIAPDGKVWAGTSLGLARQKAGGWIVRRGRRWLLHDEVRDIAFAADGTAWIATPGGVSELRQVAITLASKATNFHAILEARHVRPPGIVEKCQFPTPGEVSAWTPLDDDNDGGYTAVALAMESYRYAATHDPGAITAARRAFATCEFLEKVTRNPGFIARTVVPTNWAEVHDPNLVLTPTAQAEEIARDPRDKYVPVRWHPSEDGRWLWKGDTSSDEVTAHFFGYFVFHELAADATDRARVRGQVQRIVDHLLRNDYSLRDLDGRHTRWAVWGPAQLNDDPNWEMERGINSLELLSYLKLAAHVTGEARYEEQYRHLIREHHYDRNALNAPNLNTAWRTYIDLELLAFAYPALLALEKDPALLRVYHASFERWHDSVKADGNPFFEYLYATYRSARRANLAGSIAFLRDTPLDLVRWDIDNRSREDVVPRRFPEVERWQTTRLLPPSEIGYSRTDQNPWHVSQGEGGRTESDGVFWLLPYWMGRHQGFVK